MMTSVAYAECDRYVLGTNGKPITNERGELWCVGEYIPSNNDSNDSIQYTGNDQTAGNTGGGSGGSGSSPSGPTTGNPSTGGPSTGEPSVGNRNGKADGTNPGNPNNHDRGSQGNNNPNNARK